MSTSSISLPTTPTHANSTFSSSSSSSNSGLEDIQYLLYLETLKRFREDEISIRRQLDDKMRVYNDVKKEFLRWYGRYVKLIKLTATRNALEQDNHLHDEHVESTQRNISTIVEKTTTGIITDYLTPDGLAECKAKLAASKTYSHLTVLQQEAAARKADVRAIQSSTETVEATVETAIVHGLHYFMGELQMENFERF